MAQRYAGCSDAATWLKAHTTCAGTTAPVVTAVVYRVIMHCK
jgi:hypothetical protein